MDVAGPGPAVALVGAAMAVAAGAVDAIRPELRIGHSVRGAVGRRLDGLAARGYHIRASRAIASSVVLALPLALWTWPIPSLEMGDGTDASWIDGLHTAFHNGLAFGSDVVFTYGRWAF
jgi:hypothetical protein